jgi:hypothetical protein
MWGYGDARPDLGRRLLLIALSILNSTLRIEAGFSQDAVVL